jgi:uncharacterized protein YyaL (SSP411 family)
MMGSAPWSSQTFAFAAGVACILIAALGACSGKGCAGGSKPPPAAQLRQALLARGPDYKPRTHHFNEDGTPKYVNRLILETSPYLLQHAHNPVNWHAWGKEAFERAKTENKPILLSVGYSTCHWCHVMERESFEDEEIAAYLNEHFVAIKVDREERPEVDDLYMKAVSALAGRGGWPMTVVLTPDREPFFGGTYFPARDGDRGARKGFFTILKELQARYTTEPEQVVAQARAVSAQIRAASAPARPGAVPGPEAIERAARSLAQSFDPVWGGFGGAPKFPRPVSLELLLRYHRRTGDEQALHIVLHTLEKMASGGMYDHVGGGFHRYSVDDRWLVPHFEKMLYDNAQLVAVYLDAVQLTGREDLKRVATQTLDYVAREMTSPDGAFYSATDADSPTPGGHEEEGYFFTWTPAELEQVLGRDRTRAVTAYYGVTPAGNFEGRSILHTQRSAADVAASVGMSLMELETELNAARASLYRVRSTRPPPLRDEKILTSWNGLMISAFARGAVVLDRPDYAARARRAAEFLLEALRTKEGRLLRSHMDGRARHNGYLDDYAFLGQGLLDLYEATFDLRYLGEAISLQEQLDAQHLDEEGGGYFMTSDDHERLLARDKPAYDGAEPSGNSVALMNLLRLEEFTGREDYRRRAEKGFAAFAATMARGGPGVPKMLSALDYYLDAPFEVLIVAPQAGGAPEPLLTRLRRTFLPNRIVAVTTEGEALEQAASLLPLLQGKRALGGRTTAFVCEKGRCELPTSDPEVFARQLARTRPLFDERTPAPLPVAIPGKTPSPWEYDAAADRHWDPSHRHWHEGPPPAGR